MANLTDILVDQNSRVGALENTDIDENAYVSNITKLYAFLQTSPVFCSDVTECAETLYSSEDKDGLLSDLDTNLIYMAIGTGSAPAPYDVILASELLRKIANKFIDGDTLIADLFLDESEGNGVTYTNAGIFRGGTITVGTGSLFVGGAINTVKTNTQTLTVSYEISVQEV
jgi:hypothetical protein